MAGFNSNGSANNINLFCTHHIVLVQFHIYIGVGYSTERGEKISRENDYQLMG